MKILKGLLLVSVLLIAGQALGQDKTKQTKKFGRIDKDNNKEVTLKEMAEFYKDKTNKKGESIKYELMFLGLDSNDDGKLTLEEFVEPVNWKAAKQKKNSQKGK